MTDGAGGAVPLPAGMRSPERRASVWAGGTATPCRSLRAAAGSPPCDPPRPNTPGSAPYALRSDTAGEGDLSEGTLPRASAASPTLYLEDALLVHAHKVQRFVDEVVAKRLEQTLHQRHAQTVHSWPAGRILGLSGEILPRERC